MNIFITGTDTNIGKTLTASWLCAHTRYDYFKPIQTGSIESQDSADVLRLAKVKIHPETYIFKNPLSPHMAAEDENAMIDMSKIRMPNSSRIIVEGAGGLLVPLNDKYFISDLIVYLGLPVILVARSTLGTINHTLLSLQYLRNKNIDVLGVIMSGDINARNRDSIARYGDVEILAELPKMDRICFETLMNIPLTKKLRELLIDEEV